MRVPTLRRFWDLTRLSKISVGLWQYGLWNFQAGSTKLERFLHNNQHTQRKLSIEFWINDDLSKIGHPSSNNVI